MKLHSPLFLLCVMLVFGCSSSSENPLSPQGSYELTSSKAFETGRTLLGIWEFCADPQSQQVDIIPVRTTDIHLNAVRLLEDTACTNCLSVSDIEFDLLSHELTLDLTLIHPFPGLMKYSAFDVRGIFITDADFTFPASGMMAALGNGKPRLLNPDGHTSLFNPTEFPETLPVSAVFKYWPGNFASPGSLTATLNPFISFNPDEPRRVLLAGESSTRTLKILFTGGPFKFGYAIDCSWQFVSGTVTDPVADFPPTANCLEAYDVHVEVGHGLENTGGSALVAVTARDHQGLDGISHVTIEAPDILIGTVPLTYFETLGDDNFLFIGTIYNTLNAPAGTYPLLVHIVNLQPDPNLGQIDAWLIDEVKISELEGWAINWGARCATHGKSIVIDDSGNIYLAGFFIGNVDFDPGPGVDMHDSGIVDDVFLTKFNSEGNFVWARTWGGSHSNLGYSLALDNDGNIFVSGIFYGTADFDPGPGVYNVTAVDGVDAFLSKFNPDGNFLWVKTWGGAGNDEPYSITYANPVFIYITGYYFGTADFDPGPGVDEHTPLNLSDAFLSKLDTDGNFFWVKTWGDTGVTTYPDIPEISGQSVSVDGAGNIYTTGLFNGNIDFDPGPGEVIFQTQGDQDSFLNKFYPDGSLAWVKTWGGTGHDYGKCVANDASGNPVITGIFHETVDFDPGDGTDYHICNGFNSDVFLSKFDPDGNFIWADTWGGTGWDDVGSVVVDDQGNIYATGCFEKTADLDPGPGVDLHYSEGINPYDVFLSKFDPDGEFIWASSWGGSYMDYGYSVTLDSLAYPFVAGWFRHTADLNPGVDIEEFTAANVIDVFISKITPDGTW